MAGNKKTLSEKLSELINPNPVWEDPETEYSETTAKVVENSGEYFDDEIPAPSTLKLSQYELLDENDERYSGKKVSRKRIEDDISNIKAFSEEIADSEPSENESANSLGSEMSSEDVHSEDGESDVESEAPGSDDASLDGQGSNSIEKNQGQQIEDNSFKHILSNDFSEELEKGNAVRSQMRLWDNLLEVRIQLQKCLVASNKMPQYESYHNFKHLGEAEFQKQFSQCKKEGFGFLEKLMDLQRKLLQSYPETAQLYSGKSSDAVHSRMEVLSSDEEGSGLTNLNGEDEVPSKRRKLNKLSELIGQQHNDFKIYRNDTLEKWYNRSKVSANSMKSSNFSAFDMSVLKQLDHILSDQENLIKRTQKRRSSYRILGQTVKTTDAECIVEKDQESKVGDGIDQEIYDDDDFYHKLLRELIERKAADVTDPVQLGRQWTELQKLRRKLKKKVDTKASKGRKVRYVVHSKLVNFMAPIPNNWSNSAMDDLFRSLFGKSE